FIPLLCREQKRESVTAKELLERIQKHITAQASPVRLRGLRVIEGVKTAAEFAGPVVLENVEFMDDVILDDAIFKHSLHLIDCRFLRCLSAKNTVVEGAINLKDSYFYGAVQEVPDIADSIGEKYLPTIDLQSLNVESGFFADRVIIFGRVSVQWGRIQGGMRASGLQVYHRGNEIDGKAGLLDFSYMQVDGPLDLRGDIRTSRDPDRLQRTIIQGNVVMRGLRSYDVQLDGLRIDGDLDLQSCHITTALTMNVASCSDGDDCEVFWRPFIDGKFSAERAQIGTMDIRGCSIKKSLRLIGLKLADSFFARLDRRFRTQIGEDIVLSGAAIGGDIDLGGAKIERNFEYITGKCALLRMNPEPWMEPGKGQDKDILHFCETMASGVFLQDLHIDSGMDLTGIQLKSSNQSGNHGSSYASGSFIAHGIHLGGGLRFWREDGHLRLHDRVDRFLSSINKEKTEDLGKSIDEAIKKIKAYISNNLDLRGIHTADSINLGCCEVKGDICLENAHIGGSLRAYIEDETEVCEAQNFKADLAYIDGDADLRGMKVEGKLSAHNLQVNGNVLLACPDLKKNGQCAQIGDMIDFEGMHTEARLVLSSKNLIPKENNESSRIILARCNVGQLSIRDFKGGKTKPEFPHFMNLSAIQVGDWFLEEKKQVLALLEKTKPFDADNYIDIEHRLARIGDKKLADEVYRTMKNHVSDESSQVVSADLWERLLQGRDRLLNWLVRLPDWLNKLFSGHGTSPGWMVGWLIIWMLPVVYVLSDFRNVEFVLTVNCSYKVNEVQQAVGVSCSNKVNDVQQVVGVPYSNNEKYVLKESSWDLEKAIGLTMSYAIPFYGSRPDVVRARLIGGTCFWSPGASTNSPCNDLPISPHGFAMIFSIIQFILWIMIAANLPTIIRRRP
ncbi:MAG: hypothetical protein IT524_10230, partial [Nitrosomonas sp.]|nr:hypothetical protein [Nitrosomonas sp.]